jgi:patatin-like phospholipase/acyl hydrolase
MIRILSIDGGGSRGLIPALVLADLERRTGRAVADLFDLVGGTSTGAMIALGLMRPGPHGRPRWRAEDIVSFYLTDGPRTYRRSLARKLLTAGGYLGPKYSSRRLAASLRRHLGDTMMSEALRDTVVPVYDLPTRTPYFFKSAEARQQRQPDQAMAVVARAATAAPTYFPSVSVPGGPGRPDQLLVDGGICVVNPAICLYAEVRRDHPDEEVTLMSLGCGELTSDVASRQMRRSGSLRWVRPLFDLMMEGPEEIADYQCRQLLPAGSYFRFQVPLAPGPAPIDDASPHNQEVLRRYGLKLIEDQDARLGVVAERLLSVDRPARASRSTSRAS